MAFKSINPHNPSEVMGEFEEAGQFDVEIAVVRAREAFFEWREQPASVRGGALANIADDVEKWAEELVRFTVMEVGKPIGEARAEVKQAVAILRYYAQMVLAPEGETYPASRSKDWLITRRHPLGVCALITPWNFPVVIPVWKFAPALGYGNAVVLKPAPASTVIAGTLAPIVARHLPEGCYRSFPVELRPESCWSNTPTWQPCLSRVQSGWVGPWPDRR